MSKAPGARAAVDLPEIISGRDPRGTGNKYVYADNNPLSKVDLGGLLTIQIFDPLEGTYGETIDFVPRKDEDQSESYQLISRQAAQEINFLCGALDCTAPGTSNMLLGMGLIAPPQTETAAGQQQAQAAQSQQQGQPAQQAQAQLSGPYIADLKSPGIAPLLDPNHHPSKSDVVGNGECVSACKKFAGLKGTTTSQWRKGAKVARNRDVKPGTAIATFDSHGRYPRGQDRNSAIFLGQGANGSIWILDQWPADGSRPVHPPQPRELPFDDSRAASDNSDAYYVIMVAR